MPTTTDIAAMQIERQALVDHARQIDEVAKSEDRDLTDVECTKIESNLSRARLLGVQIEAAGKVEPEPAVVPQSGVPPLMPAPTNLLGREGQSAADAMFGQKADNGGFNSFGDFLQTVDSGRFDQRLHAANTSGTDSSGGFLIPQIYQNMFLDSAIEQTILVKRVRRFPMTSDTLNLSGFDGNDNSSNLFGGLSATWEGELSTPSEQSPKTRRVSFHAKKLMVLTQASNELVADATGYESMLGAALIQSTSWQLDYALMRGDGLGQPGA